MSNVTEQAPSVTGWRPSDLEGFARANLSVPTGTVEMDLAMHPRCVFVHVGLTAHDAGAFHADMTIRTLRAAGIRCFAVPGGSNGVNVAVTVDDRGGAYAALRGLFERHTGYVTSILPKPRTAIAAMRGDRSSTWDKLSAVRVLRLLWYRCDPSQSLVISDLAACELEFWAADDAGRLVAPRPNRGVTIVSPSAPTTEVPIDSLAPAWRSSVPRAGVVPTLCDFTGTWPDEVTFPVDVVYTWVDGSDPSWLSRRAAALGAAYHGESGSAARFLNRDELRYSLRSVHANAPWVRKIWIVTDAQRPNWLREDERLEIVDHRDIFTDVAALPTFNSHAIESQLHHIEGLSEHFLYFNDDMFLGRPVLPSAFFLPSGITRAFFSQSRVPMGEPVESDTPVDAAAKNNRALLKQEFGRTIAQTFQHTPYPLRRSIMTEIEQRFSREVEQTMRNRFRSTTDLSIPSSLHHYYALMSGRGVTGSVRYSYTQLAVPDLAERLNRLLVRRDTVAICLNDAYTVESEIEGQVAVLSPFLDAYFPVPSPWEIDVP